MLSAQLCSGPQAQPSQVLMPVLVLKGELHQMKFMAVGFAVLSALGCAAQAAKRNPPKYDEIVINGESYNPL